MVKEKLRGNKNAKQGKHSSLVMRLDVPTIDLIYDALALEGNANPSRAEIEDAARLAIRQVYGRRLEDNQATIV